MSCLNVRQNSRLERVGWADWNAWTEADPHKVRPVDMSLLFDNYINYECE